MINPRRRPPLALVIELCPLCLYLAGCGRPAPPKVGPAPVVKPDVKPLPEPTCLAVGERMTQAVQAGDVAAFDREIDWDLIYETSTANVGVDDQFRRGFISGIKRPVAPVKGFSTTLTDAVKQGASFTLLHHHLKANRPWLLFRLVTPNSAVAYYDFPLSRRPGGKVQATDIYVFTLGEPISETFRRLYVQAATQQAGGWINRLTGADQKFSKYLKSLIEINSARQNGQFRKALDDYDQLPADFRKERSLILIRLQIAQGLGDDAEYLRSIAEYRSEYPGDASVDLWSIDYHLLRKEYAESLACLDRLDKAVLGDPYLQVLRAGVHTEQHDLEAARGDLQAAIEADPNLVQAYTSQVNLALKVRDFDEILRGLRLIRDKFGPIIDDLTEVPEYKEFIESPQYQEWLKDQPAEGADQSKPPG